MLEIIKELRIPLTELTFSFSHANKPGGQNVNKVSTRVTLWFNVARSPSLTEMQRELISTRLKTRIDKRGVLRVISQKHRTQTANRSAVVERFAELLRQALHKAPPRRKTKVPRAAKQKRVESKRRRGEVKRRRSKKISWDD